MSDPKPPSGLDSELESFRQQWLSDLRTRKADAPPPPPPPPPAQAPPAAPAGRAPHSQHPILPSSSTTASTTASAETAPASSRRAAAPSPTRSRRPAPPQLDAADGGEDDYFQPQSFDDLPSTTGHTLDGSVRPSPQVATASGSRLVSALDHYEEAMEKEAQGSMGDSLKLYRQAYRLDHRVDKRYREKHFPASVPSSSSKPAPALTSTSATAPSSATAAAAQPSPQQAPAAQGEETAAQPLSTPDLIASFAALAIEPLPAHVDGDLPPPCPIAALPSELLVLILADLAAEDPAALATSAALACKRFAYLAATEQRLWRRVALGSRWGFAGMHYRYARTVDWEPVEEDDVVLNPDCLTDGELLDVEERGASGEALVITAEELRRRRAHAQLLLTSSLVPSAAYPSWRDLFRARPRIRFNGCYISTVNYIRTGQMSTNQATWGGAPVHIVTYYRYLRFFRDGSCISLTTTDAPRDVVHHLTRDALLQQRGRLNHHAHHHHHHSHNQAHALPATAAAAAAAPILSHALKGRWRLSASLRRDTAVGPHQHHRRSSAVDAVADPGTDADAEFEGDVFVETEGTSAKYTYKMDLALRSAGKGTRNNKLVWRSFWSYNKLTDDWAEFQLRNDKHFFFSRVRSYGIGE
ncbi:hypothetical protein JDV02_008973 [Purpureocillium takamizusanense]|uniref:F-box domain-containing protein n=1 Tax=Purpureocillium takamizusanense TaxID=2060973 RepID=A0A9Q8VF84_9HYPO|nr:uncharacterized protein JDV02_008973 [Purpureocillium takamizusanense]UNI23136.1 hypothetical protein JDV02_008973 [Purpureocillium takamizusanense]